MNTDYREKYLKYKVKYLELKANLDNQEAFGKKSQDIIENYIKHNVKDDGFNKLKPKSVNKEYKEILEGDKKYNEGIINEIENIGTDSIKYKRDTSLPVVQDKLKNCSGRNTPECNKLRDTKKRLETEIEKLENEVDFYKNMNSRIEEVLKILKP